MMVVVFDKFSWKYLFMERVFGTTRAQLTRTTEEVALLSFAFCFPGLCAN